jgi:pimeloyl-ACP methyl ester carboxylesterase
MEQSLTFQDPAGHTVAAILTTPVQNHFTHPPQATIPPAQPQAGQDRLISRNAPLPPSRLVVLCHGFLSNKNSTTNKALTRLLIEQGIATFRFDFFGQGDSEGPFEQITVDTAMSQALAALDLVRSKGYRRLGLIGSSFGGLVAILTATQRSDLVAVGLKCPVPDFPEMLRLEFGQAGIDRWKRTHEIPDVTGGTRPVRLSFAFYESCLLHDGYKAAEAITAPVSIIQGDQDEHVPLHQSHRLFDALHSKKDLQILKGANHGFTKADDFRTMTVMLANWMVSHLKDR